MVPVFVPPELINMFGEVYALFDATLPYTIPILLFVTFVMAWKSYIVANYIHNLEWTLFEIKIPRDIEKSPQAMEVALSAFHATPDGTWLDHWWKGRVRQWFSLEVVSFEGNVHFFVYTQKQQAEIIKSNFYSQYPEIEVQEVDDYANFLNFDPKEEKWKLFGVEFILSKDDPYPIKTYIDYELDKKSSKEEREKVDPITPMIEYLGGLGKGEYAWFQVLIRASKKRYGRGIFSLSKGRDWKEEGEILVKKIRKPEARPGQTLVYSTKLLSPGEERVVKSIERGISKLGFDAGIRAMYFAEKDIFDPAHIAGLFISFKHYGSQDMNGFKPNKKRRTDFDYPWQDFMGIRLAKRKRILISAYKKRSFFYPPHEREPFVLSTEELATIYHFPGQVAETPTFHRIPSRTGEPPRDLPR